MRVAIFENNFIWSLKERICKSNNYKCQIGWKKCLQTFAKKVDCELKGVKKRGAWGLRIVKKKGKRNKERSKETKKEIKRNSLK